MVALTPRYNTIDSLRHYTSENIAAFGRWYQSAKWNEVYDFIQFLGDFSTQTGQGPDRARARQEGSQFQLAANEVLSEEKSAYRFVSGELCEVTDEVEIRAIESVSSVDGRFAGAKTHIQRALAHFASRDSPDYRNSVKESISAVESVYSIVNGRRSGSMIEAIRVAEVKGFVLHPALKKGILSLYGWTSDEAGVRHSLFDGTGSVTSAQAKFVVVICSALVNFLIEESGGK